MTAENMEWPTRSQRRYLRRIFNGRAAPIMVEGRPFLTYKGAMQYLKTLTPDTREAVYEAMKSQAT